MKEIISPKIEINELRVENLNLGNKFLDVSFKYIIKIENLSSNGKLFKRFTIGDNIVNFILTVLDDLKNVAGVQTAEIEDLENIKERLVNTMNRLTLETKDLTKIKDHEKYMKAYNKINCYKIIFKNI